MRNKIATILLSICILGNTKSAQAWGVYGHQHIVDAAVLALPTDMGLFFYDHIDFLTEESVVPDLRKYTLNDKAEGPRHYIDLEAYNYTNAKDMPQTMQEASAKYSKDTIQRHGSLPWYIQEVMQKLTTAFKEKRKDEILFLAGDLCHYMADAHMPLHTSLNHNGQLTDQVGIHAFWESQLPELFGNKYNLHTKQGKYIKNITATTWDIIASSHVLADTLLLKEKQLENEFPKDEAYKKDAKGQLVKNVFGQPVHTYAYAKRYHTMLKGMVEVQMRKAIVATASFWYTAWVNAGKPDLGNLDAASLKSRRGQYYKEDIKEWKTGKIPGLKTNNEFK
jgi:Zinc dependent phospholipase C